jgi:hypothetical protein
MLLQGIAALVTKIASASTVAQIAAGVGVTVAGVTGAGAAGVLPGPVQDGVATAIEAVTPFDVPSSDDRVSGVDDPVRHAADPTEPSRPSSPGVSPSAVPVVVPPPAAPTSTPEVEPGDDDGIHQHRGGRTTDTVAPAPSPAPATVDDSPEVEEHHGGDDDGGSHGGSSGDDGSSRHGGDDG